MAIEYVSQAAESVGLKWYPGDTVDLQFYVKGVDWSGTYVAKLREYEEPDAPELATFTVTATYDAGNTRTLFRIQLATAIEQGCYWWSCKHSSGITRFSGAVIVNAYTD